MNVDNLSLYEIKVVASDLDEEIALAYEDYLDEDECIPMIVAGTEQSVELFVNRLWDLEFFTYDDGRQFLPLYATKDPTNTDEENECVNDDEGWDEPRRVRDADEYDILLDDDGVSLTWDGFDVFQQFAEERGA